MEVIIASVIGGVVGWILCRRNHAGSSKGIPKQDKLTGDAPGPVDPPVAADQVIDGVPDGDDAEIVDEANSPLGVDPGTVTYDVEEAIQHDVGHQTMQQGADAIEATSGRDAVATFAPRASVGSLSAFTELMPVAPTDPGADPSETPIE